MQVVFHPGLGEFNNWTRYRPGREATGIFREATDHITAPNATGHSRRQSCPHRGQSAEGYPMEKAIATVPPRATLRTGKLTRSIRPPVPRWLSGKESACQRRRRRFDPSVQKISWRGEWQSIPVFLPGEFHGYRGLVGYSSWGRKTVGHNLLT